MYHFGRNILVAFSFLVFVFMMLASSVDVCGQAVAQKTAAVRDTAAKPLHWEYRKVTIGMKADETRKALGDPRDKAADQDLYLFTDDELAQVFYDEKQLVTAISITFYKDLVTKAPTPRDVLGEDAPPKADGSIFKSVRFPKAGYSVSYSKTAGDAPSVSITFQKL
jgi:hypothetical protein